MNITKNKDKIRYFSVIREMIKTINLMDKGKPKKEKIKYLILKQIFLSIIQGIIGGIRPSLRGKSIDIASIKGLSDTNVHKYFGLYYFTGFIIDRLGNIKEINSAKMDKEIVDNFEKYTKRLFLDTDQEFRLYTPISSFNQATSTAINAIIPSIHRIISLFSSGTKGFTAGSILFFINPLLLLSLLFISGLFFIISLKHKTKMIPIFKQNRKESRETTNRISDIATNVSIIQRTGLKEKYKDIISDELNERSKRNFIIRMKDHMFYINKNIFENIFNIIIVISAFIIAISSNQPIGTVLTILDNSSQIMSTLRGFAGILSQLKQNLAEYMEAMEILQDCTLLTDKEGAKDLDLEYFRKNLPKIEFKNVTFGYKEKRNLNDEESKIYKNVLENFNLVINPGEKIAIMGKSGMGKTTILSLLIREYKLKSGEILINNTNIEDIRLNSLRKIIRYIPQFDGFLNRSIKENLLLGNPTATDEEIEKALSYAKLLESVQEKGGINTITGFNGGSFSGGQRHRIGIARAFLVNSPVMIFDEPTSDLDENTKNMIVQSILDFSKDKTSIVITHDPVVAEKFDRIIFIENGKIIEDAKPKELIKNKNSAFYKVKMQHLGEFI